MSTALLIHIGAGLVALMAGAAALTVKKGRGWHKRSGIVFAIAMLCMTAMASYLSISVPDFGNLPGGLFTAYLVATGWRHHSTQAARDWCIRTLLLRLRRDRDRFDNCVRNARTGECRWHIRRQASSIVLDLRRLRDFRRAARSQGHHAYSPAASATPRAPHLAYVRCAVFRQRIVFSGPAESDAASIQGSPILVVLAIAPLVAMAFWLWRNRRHSRLVNRPAPQA